MADTKISALAPITGAQLADDDEFVLVDKSDTTMAATGTDKRIVKSELAAGLGTTPLLAGYKTGQWYGPAGPVATTRTFGANDLRVIPYLVRQSQSFDRIGIELTTAGTGSTVFRLGIWGVDPLTGYVGALLLDAGTVDGVSATGALPKTISWASGGAKWVWLGAAAQTVSGSPILRGIQGGLPGFDPSLSSGNMLIANSLLYNNISGALASLVGVAPSATLGTIGPAIVLRAV